MKNITLADLVPVKVLYDIAKKIRARAVANARALGLPSRVHDNKEEGITGRSIGILPAKTTLHTITIDLTLNGIGLAYEYGSGIHRTRKSSGAPGTYPIPGNPVLVFEGTNKFAGQTIITPSVDHPGVAPRPFLKPAKDSLRPEIRREIARYVVDGFRLQIRGMARKV